MDRTGVKVINMGCPECYKHDVGFRIVKCKCSCGADMECFQYEYKGKKKA